MARGFDRSSDQYLMHGAGVVSGPPFTAVAWIYPIDIGEVLYSIFSLGYSGNYYDNYQCEWRPGTPKIQIYVRNSGGYGVASTTAGPTPGQWNHVVARFSSTSAREVFLNGGNKGIGTGYRVPANLPNQTGIGCYARDPGQDWMQWNGQIAEVGIWNIALTDEEIAVLAAGYSPLFVRPQNLVAYWPLIRQGSPVLNPDIVGRFNLNDYNWPTNEAHCRIRYPAPAFTPKRSIEPWAGAFGYTSIGTARRFSGDTEAAAKLEALISTTPRLTGEAGIYGG